MAKSPAHKLGQIIGNILEESLKLSLEAFADEQGLYLDKRGKRSVRGNKLKATWKDVYGNLHDLDFVLEQGGSDTQIGTPVAFIECAWRRHTRHSRNKAQEIQGAILPIADAFRNASPRKAAILAGIFTPDSIQQMETNGFRIAYIDRLSVVSAFKCVGIDPDYDENTPDDVAQQKVDDWEQLSMEEKQRVHRGVAALLTPKMTALYDELVTVLGRQLQIIRVLPLHGTATSCNSVDDAIEFIETYSETLAHHPISKYEVQIKYNNNNKIHGMFQNKSDAVVFLKNFQGSVRSELEQLQQQLEQDANEEEQK